MRAYACVCVRMLAYACVLRMRAYACVRVCMRAYACGRGAYACVGMRLRASQGRLPPLPRKVSGREVLAYPRPPPHPEMSDPASGLTLPAGAHRTLRINYLKRFIQIYHSSVNVGLLPKKTAFDAVSTCTMEASCNNFSLKRII